MFEKGPSLGIWVLVFETQFKAVCRYSKNEITRWVQHVEQELPTLPEHLSSPLVFIHVAWSLVSLLCLVNHCLSFCSFSFSGSHCIYFLPFFHLCLLILPFWNLQTFLSTMLAFTHSIYSVGGLEQVDKFTNSGSDVAVINLFLRLFFLSEMNNKTDHSRNTSLILSTGMC